jgi:hypothetical protein
MEQQHEMLEYSVVYDADLEGLIRQVNIYLSSEWQLQGGISMSTCVEFNMETNHEELVTRFAQAIVRKIKTNQK